FLRGLYAIIKGLLSQDDPLVKDLQRATYPQRPDPIARPLCHGRAFNPWRVEMCQVRISRPKTVMNLIKSRGLLFVPKTPGPDPGLL
ncbi:MAG: hypothetical protein ACP5QG_08250, partial [candidate division WOR-3 bacterium]